MIDHTIQLHGAHCHRRLILLRVTIQGDGGLGSFGDVGSGNLLRAAVVGPLLIEDELRGAAPQLIGIGEFNICRGAAAQIRVVPAADVDHMDLLTGICGNLEAGTQEIIGIRRLRIGIRHDLKDSVFTGLKAFKDRGGTDHSALDLDGFAEDLATVVGDPNAAVVRHHLFQGDINGMIHILIVQIADRQNLLGNCDGVLYVFDFPVGNLTSGPDAGEDQRGRTVVVIVDRSVCQIGRIPDIKAPRAGLSVVRRRGSLCQSVRTSRQIGIGIVIPRYGGGIAVVPRGQSECRAGKRVPCRIDFVKAEFIQRALHLGNREGRGLFLVIQVGGTVDGIFCITCKIVVFDVKTHLIGKIDQIVGPPGVGDGGDN